MEFVVFDCPLKPNQVFNLENTLHVRVLDRNMLILMIFLHHARTNEAKLQIEYAILKHQIPYVTELVRKSKHGEHPGFMAGGEYKVDEYYRLTKSRIKKIRQELVNIKTSREQRRKNRRKKGFVLVTLAGYTNAGKSALLTALTNAQVLVDSRMFSTVSPKTRRFRNSKVLFTDTVGFIQNIPTQLIEAFISTLEEITYADHIMLIVDISEQITVIKKKVQTCLKIIDQLIIKKYPLDNSSVNSANQQINAIKRPKYHIVFNKIDLEPEYDNKTTKILNELTDELKSYGQYYFYLISCKTKQGFEKIYNMLSDKDILSG